MSRVLAAAAVLILAASAAVAEPAPPVADAPVTTAPAPPPPTPPAPPVAPPAPVQVTALAAPDAFSTAGRETGLPATLWRGTSLEVVKAVLPLLAEKSLSPAGQALARRVLATGAPGPEGAGNDPALIAARTAALIAQGDPKAAAAIVARAPGLDRSPDLARVAAESALLAGDDARACGIEGALAAGREDIYWVRLRTYCQAIAGKTAEAQLTLDLAQSQANDPVFGRLMGAKIAGAGNPGAASLRNGLDYALSRNLALDLTQAKASPAVAAALAAEGPGEPAIDLSAAPAWLAPFAQSLAKGQRLAYADFMTALKAAPAATAKDRERTASAALMIVAFEGWPADDFLFREGRAPVLRDMALDAASVRKHMGETALLALWNCAEAGPAGLAIPDRARIVRALREAGFERDARAFALEGLASLK